MANAEMIDLDTSGFNPTRDLGAMAATLTPDDVTARAARWARHCILDWVAVTVGGSGEPLVGKLIDVARSEGGSGPARVIGHEGSVVGSQATLINGAASHALDYDDVNERMLGHPTVPVVPVLMALADEETVDGSALIAAFIAGYEVEVRLSDMIGVEHIDDGWHSTGTIGTFGAAMAAANLMGLSPEQTATALGIAATQAAGLKAMFGTMCKPLHAGKAAANGLLAAKLAARGFTSRDDAIECDQGFAHSQARGFKALPVRPAANGGFAVEENLFKYHAACYLTHAGIDAVRKLKDENGFAPEDVVSVHQHVPETHFSVCNVAEPVTGLETKFSMRHTAAMALSGIDTAAMGSYSDDGANREDLMELRNRIRIGARDLSSRMQADVTIDLADGRRLQARGDAGIPARDLELQEKRLVGKFRSLVVPVYGAARAEQAIEACLGLEQMEDAARVFDSVTGPA